MIGTMGCIRNKRITAVLLSAALTMSNMSVGTVAHAAENADDNGSTEYVSYDVSDDDIEESHSENIKSWLGTSLVMSEYGDNHEIITRNISKYKDGSVISSYDKQTKTLTISGNGEIDDKGYESRFAVDRYEILLPDGIGRTDIESVIVLGEKIKFPQYCSGLFSNWTNLKKADLSGFNTSNITDMGSMFSGCESLEDLDLSGFDTSNVTYMGGMFSGCKSLENLDLSGFDTSEVRDMQSMFRGCSKLEKLDLSGIDTSNVTYMGGMFSGCKSLKNLDLSGFDTSGVKEMKYMFSDCTSLKNLDLSGFITWNVDNMYSMFSGCTNLESLDLSGFDMTKVTEMKYMFSDCTSLENLKTPKKTYQNKIIAMYDEYGNRYEYLPESKTLTVPRVSLKDERIEIKVGEKIKLDAVTNDIPNLKIHWYGSDSFAEVDDEGVVTGKIAGGTTYFSAIYDWAIASCVVEVVEKKHDEEQPSEEEPSEVQPSVIDGVDISEAYDSSVIAKYNEKTATLTVSAKSGSKIMSRDIFSGVADRAKVKRVVIEDGVKAGDSLQGLFKDCTALRSVDMTGLDTSNVTDMSDMFLNCELLQSVDLKNFNTSNVTNMSYMFANSGIKDLDLSAFDTSNVIDMKFMFYNTKLKNLDLSSFNTSKVYDMIGMFADNDKLEKLNVSDFNTACLRRIVKRDYIGIDGNSDSIFKNCKSLKELDLSKWDFSNIEDAYLMFYGCSSLEKINLGNADFSNVQSMRRMFYDCSSLKELNFSGVKADNVQDAAEMFQNCSALENLKFDGFAASKIKDMRSLFSGCSSLKKIDLSGFETHNVTGDGMEYMFSGCGALEEIDVSNFDTSYVNSLRGMFSGCSSLKNLDVSKFDTSAVKYMDYMFSGCSALEELDISNFEIRDDVYADSLILGCNGLQKFTTPQNVDDSACVYIDKMYDENGNEYESLPKNSRVLYFSRIFLDKHEIELKEGESTKLNAITNNDKIKNLSIEWRSDYSNVTVDDMGNISANYVGSAYVTAQFGNSVSSCFVNVIRNEDADEPKNDYPSDDTSSDEEPEKEEEAPKDSEDIPESEKAKSDSVSNCFVACASVDIHKFMNLPSTGVKFKSSDKHIAKVNGKGIVKFKGHSGDVTITAVDKKSKDTLGNYTLHVVAPEITTSKLTLQEGDTVSYNAADYIKCAATKPLWISSKPSVVSIDATTGEIKIAGKGNAIVYAVFNGTGIKDKNGSRKRFKIKIKVA